MANGGTLLPEDKIRELQNKQKECYENIKKVQAFIDSLKLVSNGAPLGTLHDDARTYLSKCPVKKLPEQSPDASSFEVVCYKSYVGEEAEDSWT
jgi:hypothetical protein